MGEGVEYGGKDWKVVCPAQVVRRRKNTGQWEYKDVKLFLTENFEDVEIVGISQVRLKTPLSSEPNKKLQKMSENLSEILKKQVEKKKEIQFWTTKVKSTYKKSKI